MLRVFLEVLIQVTPTFLLGNPPTSFFFLPPGSTNAEYDIMMADIVMNINFFHLLQLVLMFKLQSVPVKGI